MRHFLTVDSLFALNLSDNKTIEFKAGEGVLTIGMSSSETGSLEDKSL